MVLGVSGRVSRTACLQARKAILVGFVCGSWCVGHFLGRLAQGLNSGYKPSPDIALA